ncbi:MULTISPECIES: DNA-3-methyladenine glycosylase family protein [Halolamina]|uniref:DNA-3-methyladenine glycosylase family protein n=1 Tax=Halolamina TaxID=1075397 RepID=UPI000943A90A|nr:DNA-3-methyladenine glycosylase 2 family protein [Halolamina sp. R1-12]
MTDSLETGADEAYERLQGDAYLGPIAAEVGPVSLDPAEDAFERLIVSILRQQVSVASAAATRERLFDAVDVTPEGIRAAEDEVLRDAGLSSQKTRYVNEIADAFHEQGWTREAFAAMDEAEVRATLTDITGVGPWTADMFLLFVLGRPDVFPVGDLGVRQGLQTLVDHHGEDPEMTRGEMTEFAERWAPVRSYAALYLWQVQEKLGERVGDVVED